MFCFCEFYKDVLVMFLCICLAYLDLIVLDNLLQQILFISFGKFSICLIIYYLFCIHLFHIYFIIYLKFV